RELTSTSTSWRYDLRFTRRGLPTLSHAITLPLAGLLSPRLESAWPARRPGEGHLPVSSPRVGVEPHHPALQAGFGRGIARKDQRIVPGDHVVRRGGEFFEPLITFHHFGHVVGDREDAAGLHMGVEVRRVGGEYHGAAPGLHAHALQAFRV